MIRILRNLDRWLERATDGAGLVGRWTWGLLLAASLTGLAYLLTVVRV